jgi:hypothetical protein
LQLVGTYEAPAAAAAAASEVVAPDATGSF